LISLIGLSPAKAAKVSWKVSRLICLALAAALPCIDPDRDYISSSRDNRIYRRCRICVFPLLLRLDRFMARSRMLGGISTTLLALAITSLAMVRMCVRAYIEASVWVPCGERRNASMHSVLVRGVARSNIRTLTRAHASELLTRALTCTDKHICTSTHAHSTSKQIHILNSAVCRFRSYPPIPLTPSPAARECWQLAANICQGTTRTGGGGNHTCTYASTHTRPCTC